MIKIRNLVKSFEGHEVLRGMTLDIARGESLAVIGRSGCGKSVLLKHILGLMHPDEGEVMIEGRPLGAMGWTERHKVRLKFGMVFQHSALFDSMSVAENVGFGLAENTRMKPREIRFRALECLDLVGLRAWADHAPAELSGGMRKRVAFARAIAMRPAILLYDEPTTGLDPILAGSITRLIRDTHERLNITTVVISHDMNLTFSIADRVAMLYHGKIIEVGTSEEFQKSSNPVVKQFLQGSIEGPEAVL